ncbi:Uncharacterised protein [Mycobacteroides abscessus subsp. massiliense]|nr:Uncharacterised protein [Mycobacteroides abscessus subsp. massiliense]
MGGTDDQHTGIGGDRSGLMPYESNLGVGDEAQHLVRSDEIQRGEVGVQHNRDLCRRGSHTELLSVRWKVLRY